MTYDGVLVLDNGEVFYGKMPFEGKKAGEICFNTSMTGYQEAITDPSYAGQIITFTFPYVGNTGYNREDLESLEKPAAMGIIVRNAITTDSNFRSEGNFIDFAKQRGIPILCEVDTREITHKIRSKLVSNCIISSIKSKEDVLKLLEEVQNLPQMEGMDLTSIASTKTEYVYANESAGKAVVVLDYGVKENILRIFAEYGLKVVVIPYNATLEDVLKHSPSGVFLSNGPGDPRETIKHTGKTILGIAKHGIPIFGICLGHQILCGLFGGKLIKLPQGHRGVNHPVINYETKRIEITPQNHGFACSDEALPSHLVVTHRSLFDGVIEGVEIAEGTTFDGFTVGKIFAVQYHPEGSGGPHDSRYLFEKFINLL